MHSGEIKSQQITNYIASYKIEKENGLHEPMPTVC